LISLKYSRSNETEADEYSVTYMCPTDYPDDGAAAFFEKLSESGGGATPEFLSTHPNHDNRVANAQAESVEQNCSGSLTYQSEYQAFKNMLS
jgi:predicted Zn-dependent protease